MSPNKEAITAMWFTRSARPSRLLKNLEIEPVFSGGVGRDEGTNVALAPPCTEGRNTVSISNSQSSSRQEQEVASTTVTPSQPSVIVFSLEQETDINRQV